MKNTQEKLQELVITIKKLRSPTGCPWDKKQTNLSLCRYLQAETNELIEGLEKSDYENICEELGDLLYIIVMLAEINEQENKFTLADVIHGVNEKLIRRHPHVFAGTTYETEEDLKRQWEEIKKQEKQKKEV